MFPQLYLKLCVQSWSFLAQAMPSGVPATAATTAPLALPSAAPMPAASGVPVTAASAAPAAAASAIPVTAASTAPVAPMTTIPLSTATSAPIELPMTAGAPPQLDQMIPPAAQGPVHSWLHGLVLFVYFLICVGLVVCVMFQTTKNEGLSGVIGGQVSSSVFRGKKSAEETLSTWTSRLAVAFIFFSMLIWLLFGRAV